MDRLFILNNGLSKKDLMLNDWLCCINDDPIRYKQTVPSGRRNISGYGSGNDCFVKAIEQNALIIGIKDDDTEYIAEYSSQLQPIPLDSDILEKNGWEYSSEEKSYNHKTCNFYIKVDCEFQLYVEVAGHYKVLFYVHELQHILRFCGLDEIADNLTL